MTLEKFRELKAKVIGLSDGQLADLSIYVDTEKEESYTAGLRMARRLIRLQLGLGTPDDNN